MEIRISKTIKSTNQYNNKIMRLANNKDQSNNVISD